MHTVAPGRPCVVNNPSTNPGGGVLHNRLCLEVGDPAIEVGGSPQAALAVFCVEPLWEGMLLGMCFMRAHVCAFWRTHGGLRKSGAGREGMLLGLCYMRALRCAGAGASIGRGGVRGEA